MPEGSKDLVVGPGLFAYVMDETNGSISTLVGPVKSSLSNSEYPVIYQPRTKSYERASHPEQAILPLPFANEGDYIILTNPAKDPKEEHPEYQKSNKQVLLNYGSKINIPGPITFPLWYGQEAQVVQGHGLKTNQYLVISVYNDEEARKNWAKGVIKPQTAPSTTPASGESSPGEEAPGEKQEPTAPTSSEVRSGAGIPTLTMGARLIVKGTDVSFYIPPTGVEVVKDERGKYVRDAVTLERLEYCILLDENGNKRYVRGPVVVFPEPTESFVEVRNAADGSTTRKSRAIELNEHWGLHIKVIADYEENGTKHLAGEELFITGKEQAIYFPREEHSLIKYGDQEEIHYAIAIPAGEGRYVLDRDTGQVELVMGPQIFLPDPRNKVVVRRILSDSLVGLLFPGNVEAQEHNRRLRAAQEGAGGTEEFIPEIAATHRRGRERTFAMAAEIPAETAHEGFTGEQFNRRQAYTPPRTITLDTKYDGAVTISVWVGYAVLLVKKTGERRVIVGPDSALLDYDETPMVMELSTGRPKSDDRLLKAVYLRGENNTVADKITVETKDMVTVVLEVSYRVNFEGEEREKWFRVENYVKFLTDHCRSMLRNEATHHGIEEFHAKATDIVRDNILGVQVDGERPGRHFSENNMRIYDVEVLDIKIGDHEISELLVGKQHDTVSQTLSIAREEERLILTQRHQEVTRQIDQTENETRLNQLKLEATVATQEHENAVATITAKAKERQLGLQSTQEEQSIIDAIKAAELARDKAKADQEDAIAQMMVEIEKARLDNDAEALVKKAAAITPQMIEALNTFSDADLTEKATKALAPLAILGGDSVLDVAKKLLSGTSADQVIEGLKKRATKSPVAAEQPEGRNH